MAPGLSGRYNPALPATALPRRATLPRPADGRDGPTTRTGIRVGLRFLRWGAMLTLLLAAGGPLVAESPAGEAPVEPAPEAEIPPTPEPPAFSAPHTPEAIPPDDGRLAIEFDGNRRWCTFPDDRVLRPPQMIPLRGRRGQDEIYTFGYQFTIAALRRDQPDRVLMLYESPVIRTASMRLAAKVGQGLKRRPEGPMAGREPRPTLGKREPAPGMPVPYWQEQYRCVTLSRDFEFDLQPGVYDVYVAFDLLKQDGGWVHRSNGFLTDIDIRPGQRTRVDGLIDFPGGARRHVELLRSTVEPPPAPSVPGGP